MITIRMSAEDLAHTRFAFSALWETVASLRIHHRPQSYAFHLPWLRETRPLVDRLDIEPIRELIYKGGYPDFLTLPPTTPLPRFEDELEQLRLLVTPATTSQLAKRFGVTPSAISQHLGWLKGAGLVAPQRRGRSVFYELSPIGSALLEA